MPDSDSNWFRDKWLLPLIVGVIVAAVTAGLAYLREKSFKDVTQLSYTIQEPIEVFDATKAGNIELLINGVPSPKMVSYSVRFWNSGTVPLKNLPVEIRFAPKDDKFVIHTIQHDPTSGPAAAVKEEKADNYLRKFTYELMNTQEHDTLTILANMKLTQSFGARAEGLNVQEIVAKKGESNASTPTSPVTPIIVGMIAGIAAGVFRYAKNFMGDLVKILGTFVRVTKTASVQQELEIHSAVWGVADAIVDVTDKVIAALTGGALEVRATNELGGDPRGGVPKFLIVVYSYAGKRMSKTAKEGEMLVLP